MMPGATSGWFLLLLNLLSADTREQVDGDTNRHEASDPTDDDVGGDSFISFKVLLKHICCTAPRHYMQNLEPPCEYKMVLALMMLFTQTNGNTRRSPPASCRTRQVICGFTLLNPYKPTMLRSVQDARSGHAPRESEHPAC